MTTTTTTRSYAIGTQVAAPYAHAVALARAALTDEGFGVLTEVRVDTHWPSDVVFSQHFLS